MTSPRFTAEQEELRQALLEGTAEDSIIKKHLLDDIIFHVNRLVGDARVAAEKRATQLQYNYNNQKTYAEVMSLDFRVADPNDRFAHDGSIIELIKKDIEVDIANGSITTLEEGIARLEAYRTLVTSELKIEQENFQHNTEELIAANDGHAEIAKGKILELRHSVADLPAKLDKAKKVDAHVDLTLEQKLGVKRKEGNYASKYGKHSNYTTYNSLMGSQSVHDGLMESLSISEVNYTGNAPLINESHQRFIKMLGMRDILSPFIAEFTANDNAPLDNSARVGVTLLRNLLTFPKDNLSDEVGHTIMQLIEEDIRFNINTGTIKDYTDGIKRIRAHQNLVQSYIQNLTRAVKDDKDVRDSFLNSPGTVINVVQKQLSEEMTRNKTRSTEEISYVVDIIPQKQEIHVPERRSEEINKPAESEVHIEKKLPKLDKKDISRLTKLNEDILGSLPGLIATLKQVLAEHKMTPSDSVFLLLAENKDVLSEGADGAVMRIIKTDLKECIELGYITTQEQGLQHIQKYLDTFKDIITLSSNINQKNNAEMQICRGISTKKDNLREALASDFRTDKINTYKQTYKNILGQKRFVTLKLKSSQALKKQEKELLDLGINKEFITTIQKTIKSLHTDESRTEKINAYKEMYKGTLGQKRSVTMRLMRNHTLKKQEKELLKLGVTASKLEEIRCTAKSEVTQLHTVTASTPKAEKPLKMAHRK